MKTKKLKRAEMRNKFGACFEAMRAGSAFIVEGYLVTAVKVDEKTGELSPARVAEKSAHHDLGSEHPVVHVDEACKGVDDKPVYTAKDEEKRRQLKLEGKIPLDVNEYIDESAGTLERRKCDQCGGSVNEVRERPDCVMICSGCATMADWQRARKFTAPESELYVGHHSKSPVKPLKLKKEESVFKNQAGFDNKVRAIPKPVKKRKK